jgi:hypothetical protein
MNGGSTSPVEYATYEVEVWPTVPLASYVVAGRLSADCVQFKILVRTFLFVPVGVKEAKTIL